MPDSRPTHGARELSAPYELFILALSLLSLANLVFVLFPLSEDSRNVVFVIDSTLSLIFLGDFAYRLLTAESKRIYFLRGGGWLDLIGSLPALRFARVFRVLRAIRQLRETGLGSVAAWLLRERAQSALYVIVLLGVLVLELSGVLILGVENDDPNANIQSASDALWWGYVTITTVGYGDQFPVTNAGRIVGFFLLTVGVGLFATFTGFLANAFLAPREEKPSATAGSDPKARLEEIRLRLEEQEKASSELRANLAEIESLL